MPIDIATMHTKSAYGGEGWHGRGRSMREEIGDLWTSCGMSNEWGRLRTVLLHRPGAELHASVEPEAVNMLSPLDLGRAQAQHDAIAQAYRDAGVRVWYADPSGSVSPNQMFMADLFAMTPEGAILARPASRVRAGEERVAARRLADMGVPIVRSISGTGTFEGADLIWLNENTVILGRGLRTNDTGVAQITTLLSSMGIETIVVDMPMGTMHLMGMLRIVDHDLALAWPLRFVIRGVEALQKHGYRVAYLPDDQEARTLHAFNFVTLGPREILMPAANPKTQRFYEELGIRCHTVAVDELSKAAGSIGCLSGIVHRDAIHNRH